MKRAPWIGKVLLLSAATLLAASTEYTAAQTAAAPSEAAECAQRGDSPTPVAKGPSSGTKNPGSTGWSGGGLGGSHNGISHDGRERRSRTIQPELARGLDPAKSEPRRKSSTNDCV
jgi:hypothetical protein